MIVAALLGCVGGPPGPGETGVDPGPADPCQVPVVDVGTGDDAWEDLSEGDPAVMVHGPQGGWHVLGSVRATATLQIVTVDFLITDLPSGEVIASNIYQVALREDVVECGGEYTGMYAYLSVGALENGELDTPPELLADHELLMEITVEDAAGASGYGSKIVVATLDAIDQ